ncbi:ankyrin repeat-containing protein BDA1-like [Castanea sativa]|uniref:ankyrin repeat-containing protein BDA1-like n=1 Tax=Castanea sativa TaxID=21020 RepID=UPI003F64F17C
MNERIESLNQVALQGNIDDFYNLIKNDVKLLERIDELSFVNTPLHKSTYAGHIPFSIEMMKLKPSFVSKPNPNGHCPIHLALGNGHTEMVCQLLQHNADLVHVKGMECMTPRHYAAKTNDHLTLLEIFLSICPDSITDVTKRNEATLHIALKYNKLEAFKFLVGWLLRKWPSWREILKLKDVEGNTILHIVVSKNQTQINKRFVKMIKFSNEKDAAAIDEDLEGKTALDILQEQPQEVENSKMRAILDRAGALTASSLPTVTSSYAHYLMLPKTYERVIILIGRQLKGMTDERRNALLVVAALLVTVSYQAAITPPGVLWQDDHFKYNTTDVLRRSPDDLFKLHIIAPHRAGSATARRTDPYAIFLIFNTIIFLSSTATMAFLVPPHRFVGAFLVGVSGEGFGYLLNFVEDSAGNLKVGSSLGRMVMLQSLLEEMLDSWVAGNLVDSTEPRAMTTIFTILSSIIPIETQIEFSGNKSNFLTWEDIRNLIWLEC